MTFLDTMQTAAYHLSDLMERPAGKMSCGIRVGRHYELVITSRGTDKVWDSVAIRLGGTDNDFVHCGNRCGGRNVLAALYALDMYEMFGFDALVESVSEDAEFEFDLGLHGDDYVSRNVRTILGTDRQEAA